MAWLLRIGKFIVALAPAITAVITLAINKSDPRNKAIAKAVDEENEEDKLEKALRKYCVAYFLKKQTKYEKHIIVVLQKMAQT